MRNVVYPEGPHMRAVGGLIPSTPSQIYERYTQHLMSVVGNRTAVQISTVLASMCSIIVAQIKDQS